MASILIEASVDEGLGRGGPREEGTPRYPRPLGSEKPSLNV